jgi:uncharacterized protein
VISFLKRRWWILLSIAVLLGLCRLRFDVDVLDLLPPDEPTVQGLKLYQRHFTNARELILTLRASDADQADKLTTALAARLRQQTNLIESVTSQEPWTGHPEQLGELLACMWLNQPPPSLIALTNRFTPDQLKSTLAQTRQLLATSFSMQDWLRQYDPFDLMNMPALTNIAGMSLGQNQSMFASPDGTFRVLYVQSAVDLDSYRSCESWLASVHDIVNGLRSEGPATDWNGVTVRYTGRPVFVEEIAGSMQKDMSHSVGITATIIALLFWLTHRRWKPMLWLLALLGLILFVTLALGGLILGTISVISLGFAAVLLGLAVDYAVVHYQEALAHPGLSVPEIRRAIAPSILWAAITTMSAFLVLNLGGLPGLGQLGSLVAIGVAVSALVMVMIYLPPLFPGRRIAPPTQKPASWLNYFVAPIESPSTHTATAQKPGSAAFAISIFIFIAACGVLCFLRPRMDRSGDALRPMHSEAEAALDELTDKMMELYAQPLWVIVSGENESQVYQRLTNAESLLNGAVSNQIIDKFVLPTALWPRPEYQAANKSAAMFLGNQGPLLHTIATEEGFNSNALILTDELLRTWANAATNPGVVWPTNDLSQWLLKRFVAKTPDQFFVMGLVYPATNHVDPAALASLSSRLDQNDALLSSWELLGAATLKRVESRLWRIVAPMIILVLASLWFAFRRMTEILLGGAVLCLGGLVLLAIMAIFGWSWNLMNLMALPLILGTGVDYCIFMQLALRRHGGDLLLARRSVGRALLLCGGAAMAAFGSLAFSSNAGMASLGRVCAVGIGANMLISVYLLPCWWTRATRNGS